MLDLPGPVPTILKGLFGLEQLSDDADFAEVLTSPLGEFGGPSFLSLLTQLADGQDTGRLRIGTRPSDLMASSAFAMLSPPEARTARSALSGCKCFLKEYVLTVVPPRSSTTARISKTILFLDAHARTAIPLRTLRTVSARATTQSSTRTICPRRGGCGCSKSARSGVTSCLLRWKDPASSLASMSRHLIKHVGRREHT